MVVLLVAVGGTLSSISSLVVLGESARETTLAYLAAQRQVEALRSQDFATVFPRFNSDPGDDPDGFGTASGAGFDVVGLDPAAVDGDAHTGRFLFPVDEGDPGRLREDVLFVGRRHDIDASGVIDAEDVSRTYMLLPVRVRVEWRGRSGNRFVELQTILVQP